MSCMTLPFPSQNLATLCHLVHVGHCGPKDCQDGWEPSLPASTFLLLCLLNHPALEQWLLQILWGRFCLASLKAFVIRPCFPLRSVLAQGSPASLGSRSHRGGLWLVSSFLDTGACRCQNLELLHFSDIEQIFPWTGGPGGSMSSGQQRRGNLGDEDGLFRMSLSETFLTSRCPDRLERIVWKLLFPSAVWPCRNYLTPQCLVSLCITVRLS